MNSPASVSTAVLEGGKGPPVVLLHGQGGFAAQWMPVIPGLVTTHHVIAPDLPGLGASELPGGQPDSDLLLRWLGEILERTCPTPPVVVGHSLGGSIAARGPRADKCSCDPDLGSPGSCDAAAHSRGGEYTLRMAAARDRGRRPHLLRGPTGSSPAAASCLYHSCVIAEKLPLLQQRWRTGESRLVAVAIQYTRCRSRCKVLG